MTKGEKIYGLQKRENFYTVKEVVEHNTSKDILKEEKETISLILAESQI